jgi:defect-in-organelle-trafficking protein DotD
MKISEQVLYVPTVAKPHTKAESPDPAWGGLKTALVLTALAAITALAGCAAPPPAPVPPAPDQVAQRIDDALSKVASLPEFTRGTERPVPQVVLADNTITASFHGDAAVLLKALATARGKEFRVQGPRPHLPLIVQVNASAVPLEAILRDIGYQFAQRADLVLADGHIEIRYRGNR